MSSLRHIASVAMELLAIIGLSEIAIWGVVPALTSGAIDSTEIFPHAATLAFILGCWVAWRLPAWRSANRVGVHGNDGQFAGRAAPTVATVVVAGLVITALATTWMSRHVQGEARAHFERLAERMEREIDRQMKQYTYVLHGVRGLFVGSMSVGHDEFRSYVESLDVLREFGGALGVSYIHRVPRTELDSFVRATRADHNPDFNVAADGDEPELFIVKYIEPSGPNQAALGLNIGRDSRQRAAAERAMRTGEATLTDAIRLLQDPQIRHGLSYLLPVYRSGSEPADETERVAACVGWIGIPITVEGALASVVESAEGMVDIQVFDGPEMGRDNELFNGIGNRVRTKGAPAARMFQRLGHMSVGGREWSYCISTTPRFSDMIDMTRPRNTAVIGGLLTVLLAGLVSNLAAARARAADQERREAERRLAEGERRTRAIIEMTDVIAWEFDFAANRFTYVSPQAARLGYPVEEWLQPGFWAAHIHPDDREAAQRECVEATRAGRNHRLHYRMLTAAGDVVWMDDVVSVEAGGDGSYTLRGVLIDVTDRKQGEANLLAATEALEKAQEIGRIGSWSFDLHSGRIEWSKQIYRLLDRDEALGPPDYAGALSDYAVEDMPKLDVAVQVAAKDGTPYSLTLRTRRQRNGVRFVRANGCARRDEEGRIIGLFGTAIDVTAEVEREEALRAAQREAEAANRAKSEFLANMSHEIRTPMTAILGFADLLAEDGDQQQIPDRRRDAIATIKRNGEHLLSVINDILDVSKIEAGKMRVELVPTDPVQIVEDVLALMRGRAEDKGIALRRIYATELPVSFACDPLRLKQTLVNLVGNAIKFTQRGEVVMRVALDRPAGGAAALRFEVADTGIGMSAVELARLFRPFSQADATTTRRFGGSGLGLVISKKLVELLGGEISVSSTIGKGTTFVATVTAGVIDQGCLRLPEVNWPVRPGSPEPSKTAVSDALCDALGPALTGVRILLAEDGHDNQRLITFYLRKAGAEVTIVDNGRQAVQALTIGGDLESPVRDPAPFDVVLMDMQMPELDGYMAAAQLRALGCRTPIVALTAHAMLGDREKCEAAGCDDYVTKPIEKQTLIQTCQRWSGATTKDAPPANLHTTAQRAR